MVVAVVPFHWKQEVEELVAYLAVVVVVPQS